MGSSPKVGNNQLTIFTKAHNVMEMENYEQNIIYGYTNPVKSAMYFTSPITSL